ncbi:MAG: KEOPS complex subunit Cgi121 [Candidatus Hodarchaeales archaeon]
MVFSGTLISRIESSQIRTILMNTSKKFNLLACQIVDNQFIWGYRHLFSSIWHALKAEKGDKMISKTLSIEILLYTAGNRQIKKAIELSGVNDRTKEIAGILIGNTKELVIEASSYLQQRIKYSPDLDLLEDFSNKRQNLVDLLVNDGYSAEKFSFSEIEKAVLQRIALLALE